MKLVSGSNTPYPAERKETLLMFFVLPWRLRHTGLPNTPPVVNAALIAVNVLFYLLGWCWAVGPGTRLPSIILYAFSHVDFWHLALNVWTLWVFGNPVNRRLGNGLYLTAYLGSAVVLGLFARLVLSVGLVGSSGAVFAVIAIALLLMPAAILEVGCVALFPLTIVVGLLSKPRQWFQWLARWAMFSIPALWALALVPLMELFLLFWCHWNATYLAHLLGMACGLGVVLMLPTRITMGRRWTMSGL
jgi:membrane associated rhomboid family serine protease